MRVGLPWASLLAFVRIASNARIFPRPLSVVDAWVRVEEWLDVPNVWIPLETERHREILGRLIRDTASSGNLVPDAHLAALAIEHGLVVCSTDRDFSRFKELRYDNPIG
jgi:toxin-antitoxin system PIN domain toxin